MARGARDSSLAERTVVHDQEVVVTGIGATSPLGGTATESWDGLLAGESGISTHRTGLGRQVRAARHVRRPGRVARRRRARPPRDQAARPVQPVRAHRRARGLGRRRLRPEVVPERFIVDWATGIGGVWTLLDAWDTLREKGPRRVLPMTVPMLMPNGPAAAISMSLGARAGARTVVSACASSTESIANAYEPPRSWATPTSSSPAVPRRPSTRCPSPRSPPCRPCRSATTTPPPRRAPTTSPATASCSAKEPRRWSSRPRSTPLARGAQHLRRARRLRRHRATRSTSPRPTPRAPRPPVPSSMALENADVEP